MAAHRIRASTTNNSSLPRCKSEGTLIDLSESVSEASLTDVKGMFQQYLSIAGNTVTFNLLLHLHHMEDDHITGALKSKSE